MHNPGRNRNICLVGALAGAALVAPSVLWPEEKGRVEVLAAAGFTIGVLGLLFAFLSHLEARRHARLLRGENVLARWTVPAEWAAKMKEIDRHLGDGPRALQNKLCPRPGARGEIEVVIAAEALMVGGDFHSMPVRGVALVHGPQFTAATVGGGLAGGGLLEFHVTTTVTSNASTRQWALRIPVPPGHEADVQRIHAHYRTRPENNPRPRNWRLRRTIAVTVAAVMGLVCAGSFLLLPASEGWGNPGKIALMVAMIVGVLTTPAALLLAWVWHGDVRRGL